MALEKSLVSLASDRLLLLKMKSRVVFSLVVTARLISDSDLDLFECGGQSRVIHGVHVLLGDHCDVFIHLLKWFPSTLGLVVPLPSYKHLDRLTIFIISPVVNTLD